jgi:hypothetical protein
VVEEQWEWVILQLQHPRFKLQTFHHLHHLLQDLHLQEMSSWGNLAETKIQIRLISFLMRQNLARIETVDQRGDIPDVTVVELLEVLHVKEIQSEVVLKKIVLSETIIVTEVIIAVGSATRRAIDIAVSRQEKIWSLAVTENPVEIMEENANARVIEKVGGEMEESMVVVNLIFQEKRMNMLVLLNAEMREAVVGVESWEVARSGETVGGVEEMVRREIRGSGEVKQGAIQGVMRREPVEDDKCYIWWKLRTEDGKHIKGVRLVEIYLSLLHGEHLDRRFFLQMSIFREF